MSSDQVCTRCGASGEGVEFDKDSSRKSGISTRCRPCRREITGAKVAANPELYRRIHRESQRRRREKEKAIREQENALRALPPVRRCRKCGLSAHEGATFGTDRSVSCGLKSICKVCERPISIAWKRADYIRHQEAYRAHSKEVARRYRERNQARIAEHGFLPPPSPDKACARCGATPITGAEFAVRMVSLDGWASVCKTCRSAEKRAKYRQNPVPQRLKAHQWRKNNPERFRLQSIEQRERIRAVNARLMAENGGQIPFPPHKRCPRCSRTPDQGAVFWRSVCATGGLHAFCVDCNKAWRQARAVLVPVVSQAKRCRICGATALEGARFHRNRHRKDGLETFCTRHRRKPSATARWRQRCRYWANHPETLRKKRLQPSRKKSPPRPSVQALDAVPVGRGGKYGLSLMDRVADRTAIDPQREAISRPEREAALSWLSAQDSADQDLLNTYSDCGLSVEATAEFLGTDAQAVRSALEALQRRARSEIAAQ